MEGGGNVSSPKSGLGYLFDLVFLRVSKTHDYTRFRNGQDYVFETTDNGSRGYMTGQGKGLKPGDVLLLGGRSHPVRYEIEEINYYANPHDMWIARLKRLS